MPDQALPTLDPGVDLWVDQVFRVTGDTRVAPPPEAPPVDPAAAAAWEARSRIVEPDVHRVLSGRLGDHSKIRAAWMQATELALGGWHGDALERLARVETMVAEALAAGLDESEAVPGDVVPFIRARLAWNQTRKKIAAEIGRVEQAIVKACAGDPETDFVLAETSALYDHLEDLDERLEDALDEVAGAPEGPERERGKAVARAIVAEYEATLNEPFFQDIDANPFQPAAVTSTASAALKSIAAALR